MKPVLSNILQSNLIYIKVGIAALIAAALWWNFKPSPAPVGTPAVAQSAPQLAHVATESIKPPSVAVYAPAAKKNLSLPAVVQSDRHQHVLASSRLAADRHPQTVTTTIDDTTGQTTTYVTREPLPWIAAEQTGEVRIDYGYKFEGLRAVRIARLSVREDLLQVKALDAGVRASLDSDGQVFVGVGVGWQW